MTRSSTQEVFFLPRPGGGQIYAVLTLPEQNAHPSQVALICTPIFEEYSRSYAILRELSRYLGDHGFGVLRFDYVGVGDSRAEPDTFSMSSAIEDIALLSAWLSERFPHAIIRPIAMRAGCRLMLEAISRSGYSERNQRIGTPILWDPVLDLREYILNELRSTIAGAMVIYRASVATREDIVEETARVGYCERSGFRLNHIDGYTITRELLSELTHGDHGAWSFPEFVSVLLTLSAGDGERQSKQLAGKLPKMKLYPVHDVPYWNQPPVYSQQRERLFEVTRQCMLQVS